MRNNKKGFTLIELLVVIAIIGILSSVVLASLNSARQKSRDARRVTDIKQLQLALELYYDSNSSKYPAVINGANSPLVPNYIAVVPTDPNGGVYLYAGLGSGADCLSYHLAATLEGGVTHQSLKSDVDATAGVACTGSEIADFAGTDPIYDIKP